MIIKEDSTIKKESTNNKSSQSKIGSDQISPFSQPYKYGFSTKVKTERLKKGLNERTIGTLSLKKNELPFLQKFRYKAYRKYQKLKEPSWSILEPNSISYQDISYYSAPKDKSKFSSSVELDETLDRLGLNLNKNISSNVAIDIVFDSVSVQTTFQNELIKYGILFLSISEASTFYSNIVLKYLGSVVPSGDNFFAALNSAVFSDGSFCYIPKNIKCPLDLSTYFRINDQESGQFERTLIIGEENSYLSYLEGCTAPQYDKQQLHCAIVEIVALGSANIKYSTVQNWYSGDTNGVGGIYNFVTKRGLCFGDNSKILWTQIETGSAKTWKYPSCVLIGNRSSGEFYSVALTNNFQMADTGTKMIHIGPETKSYIISKGISTGSSRNIYRGLVLINPESRKASNYSQCDSLLIGSNSSSNTFPLISVKNSSSKVEHEASTSNIGEEQIFYFMQRGLSLEETICLIVNGFCNQVFIELPLEFAMEANKLLNLKLDDSIG